MFLEPQILKDLANRIRIHSIDSTNAAGSGHPTSCCSAAEILAVLFFHEMRLKVSEPRDPASDRFVLSKGHAAPALYAAWVEAGLYTRDELMALRKFESDLEGHPTGRLPFVDFATGSLGQGLSAAAGIAWVGKNLDKADYRVYCLIGDGESSEGSIWEAMAFASHYHLGNLVAIIDVNRQGQSGVTQLQHDMDIYEARVKAFGWHAIVVDGHSIEELIQALSEAKRVGNKPTCLIAKTFKGQGIVGIADRPNWHGKSLVGKSEEALEILQRSIVNALPEKTPTRQPDAVLESLEAEPKPCRLGTPPEYAIGTKVQPRVGYHTALKKIGAMNERVIALDGDMKNSTYSQEFEKSFPDRFVECFVAEQNMVGVAVGAASRNRAIPFVSTFAAFLTRAFDQIRMAAISSSDCNFVGSHVGVSIGPDGPSQMGLEDMALFRSIPGSTVFYPSDAVAVERAVELAANTKGVCYIRLTRPELKIIYGEDEDFAVGKGKIVKWRGESGDDDRLLFVAGGITLKEAMDAAASLAAQGVGVRIMDPFTIKPFDSELLLRHSAAVGYRVLVIEDHYPEGGIGDTVAGILAEADAGIRLKRLAVNDLPRSGPAETLIREYGIGAESIVKAAKEMLRES